MRCQGSPEWCARAQARLTEVETLIAQGRGHTRVSGGGCTDPGGGIVPTERTAYEQAALLRGVLGIPAPRGATGAFEMPALDWKQIGVALVVGVGVGYVLFAAK